MNRSEFLSAQLPLDGHRQEGRQTQGVRAERVEERFDPPHRRLVAPTFAPPQPAGPMPARPRPAAGVSAAADDESRDADMAARESLLRLQAADLIERLQVWSSDLDARESQLNSRLALQDHRERQFRLWAQSRRADLEASLRAAEERAEELREAARRLAIAELSQPAR